MQLHKHEASSQNGALTLIDDFLGTIGRRNGLEHDNYSTFELYALDFLTCSIWSEARIISFENRATSKMIFEMIFEVFSVSSDGFRIT